MIYASMILHNLCVVAGESGGKQDWVQLLGQTHVVQGRLRDIELDAFYASCEKVMCEECRTAVPQRLYCVHADRIAAEDAELARSNGCRRGQRLPTIRSCADAPMVVRRDEIADKLWAQFMLRHPDFTGALTEYHLSSFSN
jgi:hypothetical protein